MRNRAPAAFGNSAPLTVPDGLPAVPDGETLLEPVPADSGVVEPSATQYDPLRLCIYTTIGVIAWLITPPLTVAIFGTIGVVGYWRARRRGLAASRCLLGDTRMVIAYLAIAAAAGATWTVWTMLD